MTPSKNSRIEIIKAISFWSGSVTIEPLSGGLTNENFKVTDAKGCYAVRLGDDIVEHQVMRFNELAASKAAHSAGISPAVVYHETGVLVLDFIPGKTLTPSDIRDEDNLEKIVDLIRTCHLKIPEHLRGPVLAFWVFHIIRDYAHRLYEGDSGYVSILPALLKKAQTLEAASDPRTLVFGHNDLMAANFLDDGKRLWLIDWDYAGFNDPLFDLGGLASNNALNEQQETQLLESYFQARLDAGVWRRYQAMKCASLLREAMWSMVSQIHSSIEFDFGRYADENLTRFDAAFHDFFNA